MRKKLYPFISILMLALFLGACSNEDILPEIDQGTNSEATSRTLTFEGYMPDDGPSTRVSIQEGENRAIDFAWEMGDKLDLLFVQETTEAIGTAEVTKLNADGQGATFSVEVPTEITKENPYSFYGVYGGAKNTNGEPIYDATNTALLKLPTIDTEGLKTENTRQNVMLHFAKENYTETEGVTPTLQFNHVGFMFTINIKVTGANFEQSFTDITNVKLAPVDATGNAITENSADYYINLKTGEFANNGDEANTFTFQYAEKNADKNIITVRNWFPQTGAAWPAQKLSVTANSVEALTARQTTAGKTTAIGDSYYLYATWDGASALDFVNKNEMEPKGSKENPYSVAEAFAKQDASKAWVRGYIVGVKTGQNYGVNFTGVTTINTNLVITDNKDETDPQKALGIQLPSGTVRDNLNLNDNSNLYKSEVLLYGSLENYFGTDAGLKNVSDYEILSTTPLFEADNTPITFTSSLNLTETIAITTNDTQEWTATSSDESWLTVAPASGTGSGAITITATENTDAATNRTATVTITPTDNAELAPIVIDVTQDKLVPLINVDPTAIVFTTASGDKALTVDANIDWTASVAIVDGAAGWLTITPVAGNSGETTITATATANSTFAVRKATINITDGADISIDVDVTQAAVIPFLNVDPTVLALDKEAATNVPVAITANVTWTAAVNTEATWLTISPANGVNDGTILVSAEANNGADARNATITITPEASSGLPAIEYSVTQAGAVAVFAEELFISEYIEGGGFNKMIEIFNGTGETVDLTGYALELYDNGSATTTPAKTQQLAGMLEHGKVVVVYHSSASIAIPTGVMKFANNTVCNHNGDDAFALTKNGVKIDIIGHIGERVNWSKGGNKTTDMTLVRRPNIKKGVTSSSTGFPELETEWIGYPKDTGDYIGFHDTNY